MGLTSLAAEGVLAVNPNDTVTTNTTVENVTQAALEHTADILFSSVFTRIVWAFVILILALVIGKIFERFCARILRELELNTAVQRISGFPIKMDEMIAGTLGKIIYIIGIVLALNQLGLTSVIFNAIAIGIMVLVIVLVILGIKDFFPNMIAGVLLSAKKLVRKGDYVCVEKTCGTITEITLLDTHIVTKGGDNVHIPNSYFLRQKVFVRKPKNSTK